MGETTCGLAPRDGASKEYQSGYWDALRAIRKGKVKDPEGKLAERTEKFLDGDAYSGGVAQALTDTGMASPLFTSTYQKGNDAYRCLVAGNPAHAKPKKGPKPAPAVSAAEPKTKIPQGKQCTTRYEQDAGLAPVYDKVETCTETLGNVLRTSTRIQTYQMSIRNDSPDTMINETLTTQDNTIGGTRGPDT
jgi:hypothetical protein